MKLRPILKTSPEHQPGTPELPNDDPRPILKTPPDSQGSDRRPGTPEYLLNDDPRPILKPINGINDDFNVANSTSTTERKTILRFADDQPCDEDELLFDSNSINNNSEETEQRSILKTPSSENSSPEHIISLDDFPTRGGGERLENRRPILKSPDSSRSTKVIGGDISEMRPILKNSNEVSLSFVSYGNYICMVSISSENLETQEKT